MNKDETIAEQLHSKVSEVLLVNHGLTEVKGLLVIAEVTNVKDETVVWSAVANVEPGQQELDRASQAALMLTYWLKTDPYAYEAITRALSALGLSNDVDALIPGKHRLS